MSIFRRRLLIQNALKQHGVLPHGYVHLQWIESTGRQYIDTGYKSIAKEINQESILAFTNKVGMHYMGGNFGTLWGHTDGRYTISEYFSNVTIDVNTFVKINSVNVFSQNQTLYLNDLVISKNNRYEFRSGVPLGVFARGDINNTFGRNAYCKMKYYKLKIGGELVRDYIPCISSTKEVGMYDLIEGKFYGSATDTPFIAGPSF